MRTERGGQRARRRLGACPTTLALILTVAMHAQPSALLSNSDALALETHIVQLVEATMISTPELSKAGAPLLASARAALTALHRDPMETAPTYRFLASIRAYLALADAVPKPYPFPQAARDQFTDLRDSAARLEAHFAALLETRDGALNGPDPDKLQRYGDIDTRLNPPDPRKPRVVFVGDSITDDWRLNEYFPDRDFVNRGISGQTTDQMLGRFEEDVVQLHPLAVVIFGGTNDLYRRIPVAAVENNIRAMAELAQFNGIRCCRSATITRTAIRTMSGRHGVRPRRFAKLTAGFRASAHPASSRSWTTIRKWWTQRGSSNRTCPMTDCIPTARDTASWRH